MLRVTIGAEVPQGVEREAVRFIVRKFTEQLTSGGEASGPTKTFAAVFTAFPLVLVGFNSTMASSRVTDRALGSGVT